MPKLLTITLARKPLSEGSVARNVLKHGTGGLNIVATRIGTTTRTNSSAGGGGNRNVLDRPFWTGLEAKEHNHGRWPANLILQHKPECGQECVEGCPVADLDAQSGVTASIRSTVAHEAYEGESVTGIWRGDSSPDNQYDDKGGASRFFKQVGGHDSDD